MKKLHPRKVIAEIDSITTELQRRLNEKAEFQDLHIKALRLCKVIFSVRRDYKTIDVNYPKSVVIVFDESFVEAGSEEIRIPSNEQLWEAQESLGKNTLSVLQEAKAVYSLKLRLQ